MRTAVARRLYAGSGGVLGCDDASGKQRGHFLSVVGRWRSVWDPCGRGRDGQLAAWPDGHSERLQVGMNDAVRCSAASQVLIGTYTQKMPWADGRADGILSAFARESAATTMATVANPSYIAATSDGRYVYAVTELADGQVTAFGRDVTTGGFRRLGSRSSSGSGPCHLAVSPDDAHVVVANYITGTVAAFPIRPDGSLDEPSSTLAHHGPGCGVVPTRQEAPHPHMITFDPMTDCVVVPDLGTDTVHFHHFHDGALEPGETVRLAPGTGPRHLAFHPSGSACYVVGELSNTLSTLLRTETGFVLADCASTLPPGTVGGMAGSVRTTPGGETVVVSNRGSNTIATFTIDSQLRPEPVGFTDSGGRTPRDMVLNIDGSVLLVANQDSDQVVCFDVDIRGQLREFSRIQAVSPVSVLVV